MQKCKTIVLKCVSIMRLITGVKNPTEKVRQYILFTSVVGYFADDQYDVLFIPYRHFVPLPPKEEARCVFASGAKQSPGRVGFRRIYTFSLRSWDISLTLNMTYILLSPSGEVARSADRG